jgi:putative MATE family efflux protein
LPLLDKAVIRRAWGIAWPLMVADSIDAVLWVTDTFFVSRLGDTAIAAVGLAGYLSWLFFIGSTAFLMGTLVLASQAYGAGEYDKASRAASESLTANMLAGLAAAALGFYVVEDALALLGGSGGVVSEGSGYFRVRALGLPLLYAAMVYDSAYRAAGLTRPVLYSTLLAASTNAVLDPILIFGLGPIPGLGVRGAALASVVAAGLGLLALVYLSRVLPFSVEPRRPGSWALKSARIGAPSLVERLAFVGGNVVYVGSVARCGEAPLAAHTIGVRIESLAFLPMFSMATAAGAMVGHEVGAGRLGEAKKVGWEVSKAIALFGAALGAAIILLSPVIPGLFTQTLEVRRLAGVYLVIAGLTEPAFGLAVGLAQSIRGAGNTLAPTVVNLGSLYTLRLLPSYTLPSLLPPGLCAIGPWLAMGLDLVSRAVFFSVLYVRRFEKLSKKLV